MEQGVVTQANKLSINLDHKLRIWSDAKTFLQYVIGLMDSIFLYKSKSVQKEIYLAFYGNKEYGEALESVSFDFLSNTFKIIADTNELRKSEKGLVMADKSVDEVFGPNVSAFDASHPDILNMVASYWIDHKETVCFESVYPVLENKDLLDLITKLKINFTSSMEPHLTCLISSSFLHISNSNEIIKHGNPNIGNRISNVADDFAKQIGPILEKLDEDGIKTTRDKAKELNNRKIKTLRGNDWLSSTVQRTYKRWQDLKAPNL